MAHNETVPPCSKPPSFPSILSGCALTIFVQVEELRCDLTRTDAKPNAQPCDRVDRKFVVEFWKPIDMKKRARPIACEVAGLLEAHRILSLWICGNGGWQSIGYRGGP